MVVTNTWKKIRCGHLTQQLPRELRSPAVLPPPCNEQVPHPENRPPVPRSVLVAGESAEGDRLGLPSTVLLELVREHFGLPLIVLREGIADKVDRNHAKRRDDKMKDSKY